MDTESWLSHFKVHGRKKQKPSEIILTQNAHKYVISWETKNKTKTTLRCYGLFGPTARSRSSAPGLQREWNTVAIAAFASD